MTTFIADYIFGARRRRSPSRPRPSFARQLVARLRGDTTPDPAARRETHGASGPDAPREIPRPDKGPSSRG